MYVFVCIYLLSYYVLTLISYLCVYRELERVVAELKESIAKKNPNSLATLIQASSLTASFQERQEEKLSALAQQQQEAARAKADYDLRLRSLRQELEKMKSQYERRVQLLEAQLGESSSSRSGHKRTQHSSITTTAAAGSTDNATSRIQ